MLKKLTFILAFSASLLHADDKGIVNITRHSEPIQTLYQGDKIELKIETDKAVAVKWFRLNEVICSGHSCKADTSKWGIGSHRVVVVAFDKAGSRSLHYRIAVMAPPPGHEPATLKPKLEEGNADSLALQANAIRARMRRGLGYAFTKNAVEVVGFVPRVVEGGENFRTQNNSWMSVGTEEKFEILLGPESEIHTQSSSTKELDLIFKKGTFRYRAFKKDIPPLQIAVGEEHTLIAGENSDFVVSEVVRKNQEDTTFAIAYRGRVDLKSKKETITLLPGQFIELRKKGKSLGQVSAVSLWEQTVTPAEKIFFASTPQYRRDVFEDFDKGQGEFALPDGSEEKSPKQIDDDRKRAQDALSRKDYIACLEIGLSQVGHHPKDLDLKRQLGQAYFELGLFNEADKYFAEITEVKQHDGISRFYQAMAAMRRKQFVEAEKLFDAAEEEPMPDLQRFHYFKGMNHFETRSWSSSRKEFTEALWLDRDPKITSSSDAYLKALRVAKWYEARARLAPFYETGLFRRTNLAQTPLPEKLQKNSSPGVEVDLDLKLYGFRGETGHLAFGYGVDRRQFLSLTEITHTKHSFYAEFGLNVKPDETFTKDFFSFAGRPFIESEAIGEERTLDTFGLEMKVASEVAYDLYFAYRSGRGVDPLPTRDDYIDVTSMEYATANDRTVSILKVTFGMLPHVSENLRLHPRYTSERVEYLSEFAAQDSWAKNTLSLGLNYAPTRRTTAETALFYSMKSLANSADSRSDKSYGLNAKYLYLLTPRWGFDTGLEFEQIKSTRESYSIQRILFSLGIQYQI